MVDPSRDPLSERLSTFIAELRSIELALKSAPGPDVLLLQEFRQVLDSTRLTAWTVNELLNVVEIKKNPEKVLSFLATERLRRSTRLLEDLRVDLYEQNVSIYTPGIEQLFEAVKTLHSQLSTVLKSQREEEIVGASDWKRIKKGPAAG